MASATPTPSTSTSRLAIWSLVTSLLSIAYLLILRMLPNNPLIIVPYLFILGVLGFGCVVGVVLGHFAIHLIKETGAKGRGIAIAGIVLGYLVIAVWVVPVVWGFVVVLFRGQSS